MSLRDWYYLTKPGIVYGNALHFIAAFLIGYTAQSSLILGLVSLLGTSLIIASACVANNYLDRNIDSRMTRTKQRALANGKLPGYEAVLFSVVLGLVGANILALAQLWLVLGLGVLAFSWYVWVYTFAKRSTIHSTLIGTVPGALPAVAGYVTNEQYSTAGAWLLFILLVAWQMPHFYAIAIYRKNEYAAAKLPVVSVVLPRAAIGLQMILWAALYVSAIVLLVATDVFSAASGVILLVGAVYWLFSIQGGARVAYKDTWARRIFKQSLLLSILLFVSGAINVFVR